MKRAHWSKHMSLFTQNKIRKVLQNLIQSSTKKPYKKWISNFFLKETFRPPTFPQH